MVKMWCVCPPCPHRGSTQGAATPGDLLGIAEEVLWQKSAASEASNLTSPSCCSSFLGDFSSFRADMGPHPGSVTLGCA